MRLLAIRGENLASLSDRFELDFEREPLRSAGLFAVTGETGAGKSTILDTLCLALYDKFPRVDTAGESEAAPDPSGKSLNASDPRAILRRGAGRGFAEVDFLARDGVRYRARCELYRARDRSSGALQPRRRSLWRVDDDGVLVAAVDSGIEMVNRRIVELTDLTFDQFRRTALLAQGDFDAFLRAESNERADLLEKITGAEIYGRLSKLAFEKDREAHQALSALEDRRRQIGVMQDEERLDRAEERARMEAQRGMLSNERDEIVESVRLLDVLTQARTRLERAQASFESAQVAVQHAASTRERLVRIASVEPLRRPREIALDAERAAADSHAHFAATSQRAEGVEAAFRSAREEAAARRKALEALDRERQVLVPLWRVASALDARVDSLAQEEATARALAEEASARVNQIGQEHAAQCAARDAAATALALACAACERLDSAKALGERWEEIDGLLKKHAGLAEKAVGAEKELRAAQAEIARTSATISAFDASDKADTATLDAVCAQIGKRSAALEALDEDGARQEDENVSQAQDAARILMRHAEDFSDASAIAARAEEDVEKFSRAAAELSVRVDLLQQGYETRSLEEKAAARLGDLAESVAGPHAAHLRAALVDGAECPVCGAREHPFAQAREELDELVATLRAKRETARSRLAQVQERLVAAHGDVAQVEVRRNAAEKAAKEAQRVVTRARERYRSERARLPVAPEEIAIATEPLSQLVLQLLAARSALADKFGAARKMREELDLLRKEEGGRRAALEGRRKEREALIARAQRAGESTARLDATINEMGERIGSLERSLAPFLALCDLTNDDLARDASSVCMRLEQLGAQWRKARADLATYDDALRVLEPRVAGLAAQLQAAAAAEVAALSALAARQRQLEDARMERATLLGGEATDLHRTRFEAAYDAAAQANAAAISAVTDVAADRAAVNANLGHAASDRDEKIRRREDARASYAAALAASGEDEAEATALLALTEEQRAGLQRVVDDADWGLAAAQALLVQRQSDFAEAEAAAPKDTPRESFEFRLQTLAQEIDSLSVRLGVLSEQLAQDDRAREAAAELTREIDAARAQRKIWAEINEAIGSREGDKFRRFAQAVTLEELVALANRRLALLAPRYALERTRDTGALGLQIVDRELGDERRSTRSLSGGERFLTSLALALALSGLEGRDSFVDTLFIDEGFGALDSATLDVAIDALETLQAQGRRVGVISHVESMQQRIATKICVERRGGGASVVRISAPGYD